MRIIRINANIFFSVVVLAAALLVSYAIVARATSPEDIVFPVAELGGCKNEQECKTFCDKPANLKPCVAFAEKHGLMSEEDARMAQNFVQAGGQGPGGCTGQEACETYCDDVSHIDECLAFAEENDLMPPEELEEARQVQAALARGATLPGGCRSKSECDTYCNNPDNMEQCIAFAEEAGFMPPEEVEEAHKVLEAIRKGAKPPPCRGKRACDDYCEKPENFEQCINFAEAAGFISPEELEMARKTGGKGPGGCRGKNQCDAFCDNEETMPICIDFAVEHGLMDAKDAEMAKKTGGKGPGNCKGKEECEAFCEDQNNQETCFDFAQEHGLIPEEDMQRMEEGRQQMMEAFSDAPPEVMGCIDEQLGAGAASSLQSGDQKMMMKFGPRIGDIMQTCFEQTMRSMAPPNGPNGMPGEMPTGPGGMPPGDFPGGSEGPMERGEGMGGEGFNEEFTAPPSPEQMQQMQQQYQQQYQEQYQQQYQEQYQQQMPSGDFQPPPSSGDMTPPPDMASPPPSSSAPRESFLGRLLQFFLNIFE